MKKIEEEVRGLDLSGLKRLRIEDLEVKLAWEFLEQNDASGAAGLLKQMVQNGTLLNGPVKEFLAAMVTVDGCRYMVLSTYFEKFNTQQERVVSLVQQLLQVHEQDKQNYEKLMNKLPKWLSKKEPLLNRLSGE